MSRAEEAALAEALSSLHVAEASASNSTASPSQPTSGFDSMSMPALYVLSQKLLKNLQTGSFATPAVRTKAVEECLAVLRSLDAKVEAADLFSTNEVADDISTESLKYLNVAFYLGDLLTNAPVTSMSRRGDFVRASVAALKRFIDRCDLLLLLSEEAKRTMDGKDSKLDPISQRNAKIAKFKRERELQSRIDALEARRAKALESRAITRRKVGVDALAAVNADYDDDDDDTNASESKSGPKTLGTVTAAHNNRSEANDVEAEAEADGEVHADERELILAYIDLNVDRAVSHLQFAQQELALLEHGKQEVELEAARVAAGGAPRPQLPGLMPPGMSQQQQQQQQQQQGKGGPIMGAGGPPRPIQVHKINDHRDAEAPIPPHMKQYLQKIKPAASTSSSSANGGSRSSSGASLSDCSAPGHVHNPHCWAARQARMAGPGSGVAGGGGGGHTHGAGCSHGHSHGGGGGMSGDPNAPWFNPSAMACEHTKDDDVRKHAGYMLSKIKGGRGQLVPACPIHGNEHPAGECPGLAAGRGGVAAGVRGVPDPVNQLVNMRTDRAQVFRDRNPYLMDLDDWALMKQQEGYLPTERDVRISERRQAEAKLREQRIADGEEDDEEQMKTQKQVYDEEEEAIMKAREWDNWKDDNEKGAGNKNYRR